MSRTRNSAWNFGAGFGYSLVSACAGLLATPLLLRWLGAERLGAYRALVDWSGYLTFMEQGLGGALMAALAVRIGQDDRPAVTRMVATGLRAYGRLALAQLAAGLVLVAGVPYLISLNQVSRHELGVAAALAFLPVVLTPLLVFRALAEARQRGYLNSILLAAQVTVMTALSLFAAWSGWGLIGQAAAFVAAQIPTLLLLMRDGGRAYGGAWKSTPEPADRSALWRLSWPTLVNSLADRIGLLSDNIIVAGIMGSAAVVPFYLTQQLALLALSQLRGIGNATWAGLADLYARDNEARLKTRLLELTGLVSGLGLALLAPIAACNPFFVRLWVGPGAYAGDALTWLSCFNALLWAIFTLWGWVLLGTGNIRRWWPFAVFFTLVNLVVSLVATARLGLIGPLIGTTVGLLTITSWALPRILSSVVGTSPLVLWRAALAPFRWGLPLFVALRSLAIYLDPRGWLELVSLVSLGAVAGLAMWWRLSLGNDERHEWLVRLKRVLDF